MKSILNKKDGFTLLEALIALMLSSMIILLLSAGLLQMNKIKEVIISDSQLVSANSDVIEGDRQIEWHLFLNQLENYLEGTKLRYVREREMSVSEWDEDEGKNVVVYYRGGGNFARAKTNGYNRLLSGISHYTLARQEGLLLLDFTFLNGENYKGRIWIDSWAKEGEIQKEE